VAVSADGGRAAFESFGVRVEVVADDAELLSRLPDALPEWRRAADGSPSARFEVSGQGVITLNGEPLSGSHLSTDVTVSVLTTRMRHHLALHAPEHIFVHAGVVSLGTTAIVIPARSFAGKTTLVAELVRQGATYYSDEYAVVDSRGLIHSYPRPLTLRPAPGWGNQHLPVSVGKIGTEAIRAGLLVITEYERGAEWNPVAGTPAEGAIAVIEHTVAARSRPGPALAAARAVASGATVLTGVRGEAGPTAAALINSVSRAF
jgi:hypothetical protein